LKSNQIPDLLNQLTTLSKIEIWSPEDHRSADNLDAQFTQLLIQAEASVPINNYWNVKLHNKHFIYQYWLAKKTGIKNKRDVSNQLLTICSKISDDNIFQNNTSRNILQQYRHARKTLIDTRTESFQTQQVFLNHLQCHHTDSGQATQAHIINQIQKSERRKQCWRTFNLLFRVLNQLVAYCMFLYQMIFHNTIANTFKFKTKTP
jgi:hypothetical protein